MRAAAVSVIATLLQSDSTISELSDQHTATLITHISLTYQQDTQEYLAKWLSEVGEQTSSTFAS
jgi:hypothetical protein